MNQRISSLQKMKLSERRNALARSITALVSPYTLENPRPRSLSPPPLRPRRMSAGSADTPRPDPVNMTGFTEEQFVCLVAAIIPAARVNKRRPQAKISKPQHYQGRRSELPNFLAQCTLYFAAIGETRDCERICTPSHYSGEQHPDGSLHM